ncbi:hypothetical protein RHSIM_RhsimUnG0085900 [Rhododendron simsii]|uniref:Uncharacterized protein n=1 Tax=Rhododendron simsii TaxID=118357 RepID=A0A834FW26_RHOSS|nr:hypothetical protein RHSIM_RhsimUnG0085900 [Rhododendron simsii]
MAKFLKKQDSYPNQFYYRFNKENLEDGELFRNQGRYNNQRQTQVNNRYNPVTLEDGAFRNQGRYNNQRSNFRPLVNSSNLSEDRGKEVWRRRGVPESSKQGGNSRFATQENGGKDEGNTISVQALMVDRRKYTVTMEEEESFRTVISTNRVPDYVVNSAPEEEDDEVDNEDGDKDASKEKEDNLVDDMDKQRVKNSVDRAKINEEEAEKLKERGFNGRHQSGLEKEPTHKNQAVQGAMPIGIPNTVESSTKESSNSAHGLVSFVQDSQSPINEECLHGANCRSQDQSAEIRLDDKEEQSQDSEIAANIQVQCDSDISIRASQVHGINLHVDLNPSAVRRNVRSQQLEASLSSKTNEIEEFIIASQEQEQNEINKEVQNTIIAGNTLGIKFGDAGIKRMTKMIENEAKILKESLKNNSFAPLMRDE